MDFAFAFMGKTKTHQPKKRGSESFVVQYGVGRFLQVWSSALQESEHVGAGCKPVLGKIVAHGIGRRRQTTNRAPILG